MAQGPCMALPPGELGGVRVRIQHKGIDPS